MRRRQPTHFDLRPSGAPRSGFTLVEALMATTVLAIVAATAALPFAAGVQNAQAAAELEQAVELGEALMEEVLARPFFEVDIKQASPGPGAGEGSRELFNNIDDFHGYAEVAGDLRNFDNLPITDPALDGFHRSVSVQYVAFPGQAADDVNSFVHIQVQVYRDGALLVTLDRIASRED